MLGTKKNKIGIIGKIILFINIIVAFCLGLSYLSLFISPEQLYFLSFLGLAYPYLIVFNILFVLYWLIRGKKFLLISLLVILIGFNNLKSNFQINAKTSDDKNLIDVMSFNVKNFDLYNYTENWEINDSCKNAILGFFRTEKPDIICLQEYTHSDLVFNTKDSLYDIFEDYHFNICPLAETSTSEFGLITISKYPIINKGVISFDSKYLNGGIYSDILINNDTVRVYNIHFESIGFSEKDYETAEQILDLDDNYTEKPEINDYKHMLIIIKNAFINRAKQAEIVKTHLDNCPYKLIICGDFNDTPISYTYKKVKSGLKDSYVESAKGFGRTYPEIFPSYRIDYILHSKDLESYNYKLGPKDLSDHRAVNCSILIK